jgi:alpha-galactosidase
LLKREEAENSLLNLGNPECRQWLTDHVCGLIKDNGIKIYRQDFNIQPLEHWRANEAPDRQGMNENQHVQGYLQYWDDVLARNPGLWLDSCASGGRRNDLETMRRSVPLHYTDFGYGDHPVKLAFHHTLYAWIPYFKESALSWDIGGRARFAHMVDSFSYHCGMAPMLSTSLDVRRDDYDYALARKMIDIWRRASHLLLYGDYYPLTPFHRTAQKWVAWQFDCPERGCGLIQGIRLPESPQETATFHPKGICPDSTYSMENPETAEAKEILGADLIRDGFTLALSKRNGAIWFYQRQQINRAHTDA